MIDYRNSKGNTPSMGTFVGRDTLPFNVTATPRQSWVYNVFIQDEISSSEDFLDAITAFNVATEEDEVVIHLNSPGGSLSAVDTLLMEMSQCRAHIHVKASGIVASAATLILMQADSYTISPYTNLLFHTASFGDSGKLQDVYEYTVFVKKRIENLIREAYTGFFTESEIEDIMVNKREFWMDADEFNKRFQNLIEEREKAAHSELSSLTDEQLENLGKQLEALEEHMLNPPSPAKKSSRKKLPIESVGKQRSKQSLKKVVC